ncbi:peptidylprolyl isomerase [Thiohalophilus sp.]|uniref:peptidylprolyl isomerase n=1 Tax=Thiohalophilus sp. TaxID=3028392 RepID=UPI002ACEC9AE|nr:peptidylprolyl isomerase [Thiohalophilus sp.]MDZ7662733.1 peptidylprolyl isomerase [Thiohalophilus sp.]
MFKRNLISLSAAVMVSGLLLSSGARAADPVAVVNGEPISQQTYERYLKYRSQQQNGQSGEIDREALINELVNRELLLQEAKKQNLDENPAVAFRLQQLQADALIQALIQKEAQSKPVSESDLKKEYEQRVAASDAKEYKASHILLKSEDEAKAIIKELDGGAVFADVAKAKSTGPTAKNGGDLGWFNANQMVPPFTQAVAKMKKGAYSKTPVKTQFGWHVIKLEDERKVTPPKFEEVKDQLRSMKSSQIIQQYVIQLRQDANVEIK